MYCAEMSSLKAIGVEGPCVDQAGENGTVV
jgi:hypothetical protein